MAHFAQLDENNNVLQVLVVRNEDIDSSNEEASGIAYLTDIFGGIWKQTSYNNNIRKNYANIGSTYNQDLDAFISPQPYPSWILNEITCKWEAPIPMPTIEYDDRFTYVWKEETVSWFKVNFE
jgi:hypothetical protein